MGLLIWPGVYSVGFLKIGDGSACHENQRIEYLESNSEGFPPFLAVSFNLVIFAFPLVSLGHLTHIHIHICVFISFIEK